MSADNRATCERRLPEDDLCLTLMFLCARASRQGFISEEELKLRLNETKRGPVFEPNLIRQMIKVANSFNNSKGVSFEQVRQRTHTTRLTCNMHQACGTHTRGPIIDRLTHDVCCLSLHAHSSSRFLLQRRDKRCRGGTASNCDTAATHCFPTPLQPSAPCLFFALSQSQHPLAPAHAIFANVTIIRETRILSRNCACSAHSRSLIAHFHTKHNRFNSFTVFAIRDLNKANQAKLAACESVCVLLLTSACLPIAFASSASTGGCSHQTCSCWQ
jgi:hypothetical protein